MDYDIIDIKSMTLREKLGQLLIVRQSDLMMKAKTGYTQMREPEEAAEIMEKNQFGGVWLHGQVDVNQMNEEFNRENIRFNSKSSMEWIENVSKGVKIPVISANDAQGVKSYSDLSGYPVGLCVGATGDGEMAYRLGRCIAAEHALAGVHWIWSPVADYVNRRSANITRQFSNTPDEIIKYAVGYMKGLQSMGLAATVKHFPGTDKMEMRDSHIVTTKMNMTMDEWHNEQGRIFKAVIDAGVDTVMSAGRAFPAADPAKVGGRHLPCGLSRAMITNLLKGEMGFDGVVVTDDVTMGCFTSFYTGGELYAEFLKAGNDMLLGVGIDAVELLEEQVQNGNLPMQRVDDAAAKVLSLKKKLGLFGVRKEPEYTVDEACEQTRKMAYDMALKSATLLRDRNNFLPVNKNKIKKVAIICYSHTSRTLEQLQAMKEEFEEHGAQVLLRKSLESFDEIKEIAAEHDLIVYAAYVGFHAPKGAPGFYGDEFWALRYAFTEGCEKSVGVSLGYPHIHFDFMDDANVFVNLYSPDEQGQRVFVKGLYGELPFIGTSPIKLDGMEG